MCWRGLRKMFISSGKSFKRQNCDTTMTIPNDISCSFLSETERVRWKQLLLLFPMTSKWSVYWGLSTPHPDRPPCLDIQVWIALCFLKANADRPPPLPPLEAACQTWKSQLRRAKRGAGPLPAAAVWPAGCTGGWDIGLWAGPTADMERKKMVRAKTSSCSVSGSRESSRCNLNLHCNLRHGYSQQKRVTYR